jgi:phosphoglycerol transferase MdoB-like AlkP superfamily enzyme
MIFFMAARGVFMVYQFSLTAPLSMSDLIWPNVLGLRMDAAMTGYWLIIPGLALVASCFFPQIAKPVISLSFYVLLFLSSLIIVADLELYAHWGFRMDTTPLLYTGSEGLGSVSIGRLLWLTILFLGFLVIMFLAFQRWIKPYLNVGRGTAKQALFMFGFVAFLFLPIRSSVRVAPLNTGVVYYHQTNPFPNHAGINVVWNFFKSVTSNDSFQYPENFVAAQTAQENFMALMAGSDSTQRVLTTDQPNVILIILEGFTAKVIAPLGGRPNITPNLNALCAEGLLWDDFYASGDRTDKGIISILSGYPAQPKTSIIKFPNKTQSLPSIPKTLKNNGYHTSFLYGGDIGFANMESYLTIAGFQHITEDDDFDLALNTSKWGVHDEFVFERLLQETDSAQAPFFKTMLSLSSHEPFDVPSGLPAQRDEESLFLNACTYTDRSLGQFITSAKEKPWWKNTLIIITADHGHPQPGQDAAHKRQRFKIPMLWLGGVVDQARMLHGTGSQTDLAATLLSQLNIASMDFTFSKNLLNTNPQKFAVYAFNNGFGYVTPQAHYVYDFDLKNFIEQTTQSDLDNARGRSYMQMVFTDYNKR